MSKKMSRGMSKFYADKNKVEIEKVLTAIHVFHEVSYDEYGMQDHPYMKLWPDGSGGIYSVGMNKCLFEFINLGAMVKKADELMEKHGIEWDE